MTWQVSVLAHDQNDVSPPIIASPTLIEAVIGFTSADAMCSNAGVSSAFDAYYLFF